MPLRVGLTYTQMKLGWADKRLNELNAEVDRFRNDAYSVREYDDLDKSFHIVHVIQNVTPDSIGMLVGEFTYALRSGLDQLAWQLALLTTDKPGRQTCFPIESECPLPSNKSYREKIADIPPAALSIIESLQPYQGWSVREKHPLWQLNKLGNIDKHRVVAIGHIPFTINTSIVANFRVNLQDTVEIVVPLDQKADLKIDVKVPSIVFGDPIDVTDGISSFEITIHEMRKIYDFVRNDVVPKLAGCFPQ
jgi:hypothetical protein